MVRPFAELGFTGVRAGSENADPGADRISVYGMDVISGEFVDLRAAVDILFGKWSLL